MKHLLKNIRIDEVSLVRGGANQHANIKFYKSRDPEKDELIEKFETILRTLSSDELQKAYAIISRDEAPLGKGQNGDIRSAPSNSGQIARLAQKLREANPKLTVVEAYDQARRQLNKSSGESPMNEHSVGTMIAFAKHAIEQGETHFSKADFYKAIRDGAEASRKAGESEAVAFTRYATETEDGRVLWRAMMRLASGLFHGSGVSP